MRLLGMIILFGLIFSGVAYELADMASGGGIGASFLFTIGLVTLLIITFARKANKTK